MASACKGILIRSAPDNCSHTLLKVKQSDQIGYLKEQNLPDCSHCISSQRVQFQNRKCLRQLPSHMRPQVVMALISDPMSTTKKVDY